MVGSETGCGVISRNGTVLAPRTVTEQNPRGVNLVLTGTHCTGRAWVRRVVRPRHESLALIKETDVSCDDNTLEGGNVDL